MQSLRLLCLAAFLLPVSLASFCGNSAIPFSFEALPDGQPVLGCARPSCFGWTPQGKPASNNANFYRINQRPDGFMRKDRNSVAAWSTSDPRRYKEYISNCEPTYQSTSCDSETSWVGGIAPLLNVSSYSAVLQCCTYPPLRLSTDRGVATVNPGQIVIGGEVSKNERQFAFDYISDVEKVINAGGTVSYKVKVRRLPCLPTTETTPSNEYEDSEAAILQFNQGSSSNFKGTNKAFQAHAASESKLVRLDNSNQFSNSNNQIYESQEKGLDGPFDELVPQTSANGNENNKAHGVGTYNVGPPPLPPVNQYAAAQPAPYIPQSQPGYAIAPQPSVQSSYYPVSSYGGSSGCCGGGVGASYGGASYGGGGYGGGGYGGGGYFCFAKDTEVKLMDGRRKRMDELSSDDWIETVTEEGVRYFPIDFWLHRLPQQEAQFYKVSTEHGNVLKLTGQHYIFRTSCDNMNQKVNVERLSKKPVLAEELNVGDCLYRVDGSDVYKTRIADISIVNDTGIYSPMLQNGRISVNGIYASCHSIWESHSLQNTFFAHVEFMSNFYNSIFGAEDDTTRDVPLGMATVLDMMSLILPKNLVTL